MSSFLTLVIMIVHMTGEHLEYAGEKTLDSHLIVYLRRTAHKRKYIRTQPRLCWRESWMATMRPFLPMVLQVSSFFSSIFLNNPEGAGKTYTMMGSDSSGPGVLPLTVIDLFSMIQHNRDRQYKITVSFLEVYNEMIRDLLVDLPQSQYESESEEKRRTKDKKSKVFSIYYLNT